MNTTKTVKKLQTTLMMTSASLLASNLSVAGNLGNLAILTPADQPLHAELEIKNIGVNELANTSARILSQEAFKSKGVAYDPAIRDLRLQFEVKNNRPFLKINSNKPIETDKIDLIIELQNNGNRELRRFQLDFSESRALKSQTKVNNPSNTVSETPYLIDTIVATQNTYKNKNTVKNPGQSNSLSNLNNAKSLTDNLNRPSKIGSDKRAVDESKNQGDKSKYVTKKGDTLSKIARQLNYSGVNLEKLLASIYKTNPSAFEGNINRLKKGAALTIPSAQSVQQDNEKITVATNTKGFNQYRNKLAKVPTIKTISKTEKGNRSFEGKVAAKITDTTEKALDSSDKLSISKTVATAAVQKLANAQIQKSVEKENKIAAKKFLDDKTQKLEQLKENVLTMQKTIEKTIETKKKELKAAIISGPAITLPGVSSGINDSLENNKGKPVAEIVIPAIQNSAESTENSNLWQDFEKEKDSANNTNVSEDKSRGASLLGKIWQFLTKRLVWVSAAILLAIISLYKLLSLFLSRRSRKNIEQKTSLIHTTSHSTGHLAQKNTNNITNVNTAATVKPVAIVQEGVIDPMSLSIPLVNQQSMTTAQVRPQLFSESVKNPSASSLSQNIDALLSGASSELTSLQKPEVQTAKVISPINASRNEVLKQNLDLNKLSTDADLSIRMPQLDASAGLQNVATKAKEIISTLLTPEESQTKFRLFDAYKALGDKDSMQNILKEVVLRGDESNKLRAQALLSNFS